MRVNVVFTPDEAIDAPVAVVVDVIRATSTITQGARGRLSACAVRGELDEARAVRAQLGEGLLWAVSGMRFGSRAFDVGALSARFRRGRAETLILSTTNGTRAILTAAERSNAVLIGSLLNLRCSAGAVEERDEVRSSSAPGSRAASRRTMPTARDGSSSSLDAELS
jgi:2-phosphosulfolactate phosphatase